MSGHSKWSTIKHKKAATDKKRADIFSKMAKAITVAASLGGGDSQVNYTLRTEIEKARGLNMPKDRIEAAIGKGVGKDKGGMQLEELLIECYGPNNSAIIVKTITDNRNRTTSEIKQILTKNNGKFVGEGGVRWMFEELGVVRADEGQIDNKEEFEFLAIDAGAKDILKEENFYIIYTDIQNLQKVENTLEKYGIKNASTGLEWVAKDKINLSESEMEKLEKLFNALDENEDVQEIYSNIK